MISSISKVPERKLNEFTTLPESEEQNTIRWTWACRLLDRELTYEIDGDHLDTPPVSGDLALFRVTRVGAHTRVINTVNQKVRIYAGDVCIGVFGNRYATDALEAEVQGLRNLSLLTTAGMVGTVKSKHSSISRTTQVAFLGYLKSSQTQINLKRIFSTNSKVKNCQIDEAINLILVVGSGMNSGKTTTCRKLIKSLTQRGTRVAACKVTGSISPRDTDEMISAGAIYVTDFSDYGFPSTYKCDREELMFLFETMLADLSQYKPDLIIMEIADGVLQRETNQLLNEPLFKKWAKGVIVTADSAPAALYSVEYLQSKGFRTLCLSGSITSSPLYVKEFKDRHDVPVISSKPSLMDFAPIFEEIVKLDKSIV